MRVPWLLDLSPDGVLVDLSVDDVMHDLEPTWADGWLQPAPPPAEAVTPAGRDGAERHRARDVLR